MKTSETKNGHWSLEDAKEHADVKDLVSNVIFAIIKSYVYTECKLFNGFKAITLEKRKTDVSGKW